MKTENDVKKKLKIAEVNLRQVTEEFEKYDNPEDMESMMRLEREIKTLDWVLDRESIDS